MLRLLQRFWAWRTAVETVCGDVGRAVQCEGWGLRAVAFGQLIFAARHTPIRRAGSSRSCRSRSTGRSSSVGMVAGASTRVGCTLLALAVATIGPLLSFPQP